MSYVTATQLIDGPDSLKELSELYGIAAALLAATINEASRSAWTPDEIADADAALASVKRFITQADGEVDTRLAIRGYALPQNPTQFPVLSVWARAIARYHIHRQRDRTTEETGRIERDYRDALRALDLVAQGKLSLGAGDPMAADPTASDGGATRVQSQGRMFSRGSLGRL